MPWPPYQKNEIFQVNSKLAPGDRFHTESLLPVIDQLFIALTERMTAYELVCSKFGFLADIIVSSPKTLKEEAQKLVNAYPNNLDDNLEIELLHFSSFIKIM